MKKVNIVLFISLAFVVVSLVVTVLGEGDDLESTLATLGVKGNGDQEAPPLEPLHGGEAVGVEAQMRGISTPERTLETVFGDTEQELVCELCHDVEVTKSFHAPEKIIKIEAREGLRRRLCPDCHGLEGADPDRQMTDPGEIRFDPNVSVNGLFRLSIDVPHYVHKEKLVSGELECGVCHFKDYSAFKVMIPEVDVSDGQILFCQNCKLHPERGNYIAIHVEVAGRACTICHTGDLLEIHRRATMELGKP
ncbi:MAG: hypothetical protein V3V92_04650 [Candidatus Hydrothermarchaeales archaeon]